MASDVWAVLPMRGPETAKSRLSAVLSRSARERIARAMFDDVLNAALEALGRVLVVTPSHLILDRARGRGAEILYRPPTGYASAATDGIARLQARGAGAALILPADLPLLRPEDVRALAAALRDGVGVVACADRHGDGTNALLQALPVSLSPLFGARSFERHRVAALELGLGWRELALPRVAFDVDTPADLQLLKGLQPGPATADVLEELSERIGVEPPASVT